MRIAVAGCSCCARAAPSSASSCRVPLIRYCCSIPSVAEEGSTQVKSSSTLTHKLLRTFGFFFNGGGSSNDLEEGLLGNSSGRRKSDRIKRDIIITLLAMCFSLFIRFLWLALTIAGDFFSSDITRYSRGVCADDQPEVFLLFVTANAVPWVIYALHVVAQPLPVFVTVWTMGAVGDAPLRLRR